MTSTHVDSIQVPVPHGQKLTSTYHAHLRSHSTRTTADRRYYFLNDDATSATLRVRNESRCYYSNANATATVGRGMRQQRALHRILENSDSTSLL